uniref:Uncharacterized protein n=1 Tax=Haptolina brevifila TaxID=156173 RepID=A0A7S2GB07_9EUKA
MCCGHASPRRGRRLIATGWNLAESPSPGMRCLTLRGSGGFQPDGTTTGPPFRGVIDMERLLADPPKPPRSCPEGKSLWLHSNQLDDECIDMFAHTLRRGDWRHLTYLNLGGNQFTCVGMSALAGAITQEALPLLEFLSITEVEIADIGMKALCAALEHMPKLRCLEMTKCQVGVVGWTAFAAAAMKGAALQELETLYASDNNIGDVGMKAICDTFAAGRFPKVQAMHIRAAQIGDEGCLALADSIELGHFDHVRHVQLGGNVQTRDGFEVVMDVIKEYEKKILKCHF